MTRSHETAPTTNATEPNTALADTDERADAALRYRHGLAPEDALRQPYYQALSVALSESDVAVDLLCRVPREQRNSMLILAILHYASLRGHPVLTPLYESLNVGTRPTPEEFASQVVDVLHDDPDLVASQLHRRTQTNEVGRSAVLQAVLRELAREGLDRVNLIDVGTSAGLNLYLDQYQVSREPSSDPLTLTCEYLEDSYRPGPLPQIASRIGLDQNPLDLNSADDAMWLRACLWPENPERLARLTAIEHHIASWPPRVLLRGDALTALDEALAMVDPSAATVVMHTWVAAYFPEDLQRAFASRMLELVSASRVHWLYLEWPRAVKALQPPKPPAVSPRPGASQIVLARAGDEPRHVGWCHSHGRWLSLSALKA